MYRELLGDELAGSVVMQTESSRRQGCMEHSPWPAARRRNPPAISRYIRYACWMAARAATFTMSESTLLSQELLDCIESERAKYGVPGFALTVVRARNSTDASNTTEFDEQVASFGVRNAQNDTFDHDVSLGRKGAI